MKLLRWLAVPLILIFLPLPASASDLQRIDHPSWSETFDAAGVRGTIVILDERGSIMHVHDPERARQPYRPASTFKIFNAMAAIDSAAVSDEFEPVVWDGRVRALGGKPVSEWNRGNSLASAMKYSTIWFYQEMARRVGVQRMVAWLEGVGYGNADIAGGIDQFWLTGGLRISAEQQVHFLRRLASGDLPFSSRAQEIARRITIVEDAPGYILHAKTGWVQDAASEAHGRSKGAELGWYVGWLEHAGSRWFFALNIDVSDPKDLKQRAILTRELLQRVGAFGEPGPA